MDLLRGLLGMARLRVPLALALLAVTAVACSDHPLTGPEAQSDGGPQELILGEGSDAIKVMTWNVYVGANLDPLLVVPPEQIPFEVTKAFQQLLSTNFPERARAIARQVAQSPPHLIGLQEISEVRLQLRGDFFEDPTPNASYLLYDYLDILMSALRARGLNYRVAGVIENADVELPMVVSADPLLFSDVRLTDFDVVLARWDVGIEDVDAANYVMHLQVPVAHPVDPNFAIDVKRGYVSVDARVKGKTYRFANTHLEPVQLTDEQCADLGIPPQYCPEFFQRAEAMELVAAVQTDAYPVIIVGDLNTHGPTPTVPDPGPAYQYLVAPTAVGGAGLVDTWFANLLPPGPHDGLTNPHDADLRNATVNFTKRIDLILVNTPPSSVHAWIVGDEQRDRTFPQWLWPSDHAGVVGALQFPLSGPLALGDE